MSLIDDWDIEREHIYKFFEDELIDVSGCDIFDFVHGEFKKDLKEKSVETKENTGKEEEKGTGGDEEDAANDEDEIENTDVAEETTKKSAADEEELDYARQIAYEHDYVCDGTHEVGDLKQEKDGKHAKEQYFLYKKRCQICDVVFV